MDKEARDALLVQLLQEKITRLRVLISDLQDAGENLYRDVGFMEPKNPDTFAMPIHERHLEEWRSESIRARNTLREG